MLLGCEISCTLYITNNYAENIQQEIERAPIYFIAPPENYLHHVS